MATYGSAVRRGLPRVPDGEPWPPADDAPVPNGDGGGEVVPSLSVQTGSVAAASSAAVTQSAPAPAAEPAASPSAGPETGGTSAVAGAASSVVGGGERAIRRGLPRVPGGEPWPPASVVAAAAAPAPPVAAAPAAAPVAAAPAAAPEAATPADEAPEARDLAARPPALRRGSPAHTFRAGARTGIRTGSAASPACSRYGPIPSAGT